MKLCKDCKHCVHQYPEVKFSDCGYPYRINEKWLCTRKASTDLVTGGKHGEITDCKDEREDAKRLEEFRCGKKGKFWEAK